MASSVSRKKSPKLKPGGLVFLAPEGSIGSDQRHSLVEVKGTGSDLVVSAIPGAVLVRGETLVSVDGYHLTIHRNLMTHLKKDRDARSAIEVSSAAIVDGAPASDAVHLITIGAAPPGSLIPQQGRFQKQYQGGTEIIPVNDDERYSRFTSHLIVDIWATRPGFNCPGRLPAQWKNARPALTIDGSAITGPVEATWAFRDKNPPNIWFFFRHWFAKIPQLASTPFFFSATMSRFSTEELLKSRSVVGGRWDIRGWPAHVVFNVGGYRTTMTPAEARSLASILMTVENTDIKGIPMVPIPAAGQASAFVAVQEKESIIEALRSAAAFAENAAQDPTV